MAKAQTRCFWAGNDALMIDYHDREWGAPLHDDHRLFEVLVLDAAQAGLSWRTILHKREAYRLAFSGFDPRKVARFDKRRIARLLQNEGIVRNRLKVQSAVTNARAFLAVQEEFGTFDEYLWRFVDGRPKQNRWKSHGQIPARTSDSDTLSKDLKGRGFNFVGSTICYAMMQAIGMVNDHTLDCFRYKKLGRAKG